MTTIPTIKIEHILKGRIKMKGMIKLLAEYTLSSKKGSPLRYDYSQMTLSGTESSGKLTYMLTTESKRGAEKLSTSDLSEILKEMLAYAPAKSWELVKKVEG